MLCSRHPRSKAARGRPRMPASTSACNAPANGPPHLDHTAHGSAGLGGRVGGRDTSLQCKQTPPRTRETACRARARSGCARAYTGRMTGSGEGRVESNHLPAPRSTARPHDGERDLIVAAKGGKRDALSCHVGAPRSLARSLAHPRARNICTASTSVACRFGPRLRRTYTYCDLYERVSRVSVSVGLVEGCAYSQRIPSP